VAAADAPAKELADLLDETIRDAKYAGRSRTSRSWPRRPDAPPAKREVGYAVLVSVANSRLTKPGEKERAAKAIEAGWEQPKDRRQPAAGRRADAGGEYRRWSRRWRPTRAPTWCGPPPTRPAGSG
jgi:hypothetical protein